jgi:Asp-tRNA(Asn)/Glu-tRNA(Gln) amidotransferase A subunit family amidase
MGFFHDRANPDVRRAVQAAIERIRAAGATVEAVELPASFAGVVTAHRLVMAVGAAAFHRETFASRRNDYGPRIASLIEEGLKADATDYARAIELQLLFRRDMERLFETTKFDALAMPAVSNTAPAVDTTGEPSFQAPWSFAGLPVVSLPWGLGDEGLPAAVQFVGPAWHELPLLPTAAWCERAIGFTARPPL